MKSIFRMIVSLSFIVCFQLNYNLSSHATLDDQEEKTEACTKLAKSKGFPEGKEYNAAECTVQSTGGRWGDGSCGLSGVITNILGEEYRIECCCGRGEPPTEEEIDAACDARAKSQDSALIGFGYVPRQCRARRCGSVEIRGQYREYCCCGHNANTGDKCCD